MIKLAIIGGGDLGKVIAHLISELSEYKLVGFFDDYANAEQLVNVQGFEFPILGKTDDVSAQFEKGNFDQLLIGIGYHHFAVRQMMFERWKGKIPFANLIHPSAIVDKSFRMGEGNVVLAGCVLDKNVVIENNVLLNIGVTIAHDGHIEDHSFLGPSCVLAGFVNVGKRCFLGVGSVVIDNIKILDDVQLGGGALVIDDISRRGLYVGSPVRFLKS